MIAACAVIAIELGMPGAHGAFGAATPAARETSEIVVSRLDVVVRSATRKAPPVARPALGTNHAVAAAALRAPASATAARLAAPVPAFPSARPEQSRRRKQALDTEDPWVGQED